MSSKEFKDGLRFVIILALGSILCCGVVLSVLYASAWVEKFLQGDQKSLGTPEEVQPVVISQDVSPQLTFEIETVATREGAGTMDGIKIVKFNFSNRLYIMNSYGCFYPVVNDNGHHMTLAEFQQTVNEGGNHG